MQRLCFGEFSAEIDDSRCHGLYRGRVPIGLSDVPRKVLFILLQHRPRPVPAKTPAPGAVASRGQSEQRRKAGAVAARGDGRRTQGTVHEDAEEGGLRLRHAGDGGNRGDRVEERPLCARAPAAPPPPARPNGDWRGKNWSVISGAHACTTSSCCEEAIGECDSRVRLIASHRHLPLDDRLAHEPVLVPRHSVTIGPWPAPTGPDSGIASSAADLVRYANHTPILVNVGSYAPACIAVLQSLRRRYGLDVRSDFQDLTGRQQILRLQYDDEADFLFAPHAPFLLVGDRAPAAIAGSRRSTPTSRPCSARRGHRGGAGASSWSTRTDPPRSR